MIDPFFMVFPQGYHIYPRGCPRFWGKKCPLKNSADILKRNLLGAEDPVAGIAQTGDDVSVVVQLFIQRCQVDFHVGMGFLDSLHALGAADELHNDKE